MSGSNDQQRDFGRRKEPPKIYIARDGELRAVTVRPWFMGTAAGLLVMFGVGYFAATAYLLLDGRENRPETATESALADLRAQIDWDEADQVMQGLTVDERLKSMRHRQHRIDRQHDMLQDLIERAAVAGIAVAQAAAPRPSPKPGTPEAIARRAYPAIARLDAAIEQAERLQNQAAFALKAAARKKSATFEHVLETLEPGTGIAVADASGGPFVAMDGDLQSRFADNLMDAHQRLDALNRMRDAIDKLPIRSPVLGSGVSSRYGRRVDPFLSRPAFHAGIDYRAATGDPVRATASGTVRHAGRLGGYGLLVELKHERGLTTRYAHLSKIDVKRGQKVEAGQIIGRIGSTGRSTGPHLHYETRKWGRSVNPMKYLRFSGKL